MTKAKDTPCMFCAEAPCVCNKPVKPAKVAKAKPPAVARNVVTVEPRFEARATHVTTAEDLDERSALEALLPILCRDDYAKVKEQLKRTIPQELERRIMDWRRRNGMA